MQKGIVKIGPVVISFPCLFEANVYNNKRTFQLIAIFKGGAEGPYAGALKTMKAAGEATVKEAFPNGKLPNGFKNPFQYDAGEKGYEGYDEGDVYVKIWRHERFGHVRVVGRDRNPITEADIYPGCEVIVAARPYVYWNKEFNSRGLAFGLEAVQKFADRERVGGFEEINVEETFDELEVEVTNEGADSPDGEIAF